MVPTRLTIFQGLLKNFCLENIRSRISIVKAQLDSSWKCSDTLLRVEISSLREGLVSRRKE